MLKAARLSVTQEVQVRSLGEEPSFPRRPKVGCNTVNVEMLVRIEPREPNFNAWVAQLAEQTVLTREIVGSTPTLGTKFVAE